MIGKHIWLRDINRRQYRRDKNGKPYGAPIEKGYWIPCKVIGETRVSWLLEDNRKAPKRGGHGIAFSEEEVAQLCYVAENRYHIADMVRQLGYNQLKMIADLIGYTAKRE